MEQSITDQRKLELIIQTGLLLAKHSDLQTIVQSATDAGLQLCGAQFGVFFYNVTDTSGETYQLYALSGVDREKFSKFPMPRNTAIFGPTFRGEGIVRSGDITRDPRYSLNPPYYGMPKGHLPVRSYLAIPVSAQFGEVLGGLFYGHEDADVFDEKAENLLVTVVAQAAIAIENVRLREQLNWKIDALQKSEFLQQEASKSVNELAAIVESSDDAILSKDLTGRIASWNKAASRIFGYASEEMVGSSIYKLIPEELHSEEEKILQKIRSGERIEHYETVRMTKEGRRLDVSLTISPVRDSSGVIVGASKILRDISRQKRIEQSLTQAGKIAATGRMAATIAHEINNPLEAVGNLVYLAKVEVANPEKVTEYLNAVESEIARVSHIARQTLGYYREHTSAVATSLSSLTAETTKIYEPKCKSVGIRVEMKLASVPQIVMRRGEVMQVISNLVNNAIYAMPSGGTLSLAVDEFVDKGRMGVMLTVEDNGIGVSAQNLPRIFEPFFTTRKEVGTGIGLWVAKQLIEEHSGSIEVESNTEPGSHGTKFSIFLPLQPSDTPTAPPTQERLKLRYQFAKCP